MGPEDRFKNRILRVIKTYGGWWYTTPRSRFGKVGIPDVIGCLCGRFIAIEFKAPGSSYTTTSSQNMNLNHIQSCGGHAFVCDSEEAANAIIQFVQDVITETYA